MGVKKVMYTEPAAKLVQLLTKANIPSIRFMELMVYLRSENRSPFDIDRDLGIERNTVRKMHCRRPDLIKKVTEDIPPELRNKGKPPIHYKLTKAGKALIDELNQLLK